MSLLCCADREEECVRQRGDCLLATAGIWSTKDFVPMRETQPGKGAGCVMCVFIDAETSTLSIARKIFLPVDEQSH